MTEKASFSSSAMIRTELLEIADTVAREKSIQREEVIEAMENAIQKASRAKYGHERDIRAFIDRKTGEISLTLYHEVVEEVENDMTQLTLEDAQKIDPSTQVGDFIKDPLPPIDFGRVAAQTAKQVIYQKVREAERLHQYNEYKDRKGDVISGTVKRVEFGHVWVDLGQGDGFLAKDQLIQRESYRPGDRVRAYVMDVRQELRGPQVFLSRTHPDFMRQLFTQEVPEIYEGIIKIISIARDPGSRAKMAVMTEDRTLDPVGSCVGVRGSRVQNITNELQGEKVDIIPWSDNPAVFVVNALVPAEVTKVVLDEESKRVSVIVEDEQKNLAIGRRGQNVRLASELTQWGIDIVSQSDDSERRQMEANAKTAALMQALNIDDIMARVLLSEGIESVEDFSLITEDDLGSIEGFDEDTVRELIRRAKDFMDKQKKELEKICKASKIEPDLAHFEGMTLDLLKGLVKEGIQTLDGFAGLATDELLEICPELSVEKANGMIMKARSSWFEDEEEATNQTQAPKAKDDTKVEEEDNAE